MVRLAENVPGVPGRQTLEDFARTPEGRGYHLVGGTIYHVDDDPSPGHQRLQGWLFRRLADHAESHGLGEVTLSNNVALSRHDCPIPDLCFLARGGRARVGPHHIEGPPELVVEILSPSTRRFDTTVKLSLYARHGVGECWLVDPVATRVTIHDFALSPSAPSATLGRADTLTSPRLPGLAIPVAALFDQPPLRRA
jgi:Uma2 family endonuclease